MPAKRDYYEVLGIARDADQKAIKNAFRDLALKYHPDRNKEPGAEERFKEIAEAYAILQDPKKRRDYDARGHAGVADFAPEDLFGGIDFGDIFAGFDIGFGGGSLFDRLFRRRAGPRRGADVEIGVFVPLEKVVTGGEETVQLAHATVCGSCGGSGAKPGTAPRNCASCGGRGQLVRSERKGGVSFQQINTCPDCRGKGSFIDEPCPDCGGRGETYHDEPLTVKIPAGVEEGTALRIPGHGRPAAEAGGAAGDLFVIVRTAADPRFERHGASLWRRHTITLVDAVLGTTLICPTLDGEVTVDVPAGTQPESVLRLREMGLPQWGGGGRGDLFLKIEVQVPEELSPEERKLYERLRELAGKSGRA